MALLQTTSVRFSQYTWALINQLITDDTFCRRLTLAASYQLSQSLNIGSALPKKVG